MRTDKRSQLRNLGLLSACCAHKAPELYQVTDWHWFLIYRILEVYIECHNDTYKDHDSYMEFFDPEQSKADDQLYGRTKTKKHWMNRRLGFETYTEHFFWDYDFLMGPEIGNASNVKTIQAALGIEDSTINFLSGRKASEEDLKIAVWQGNSKPSLEIAS